VDPLRANDLEIARNTPPEVKLAQALDLMETGIRLKRAALRQANPSMTDADLDEALERWLMRDD